MPAAAVIPAPIAYTKVVAVKKLVVGFLAGTAGRSRKGLYCCWFPSSLGRAALTLSCRRRDPYLLL